MKTIKNKVIRYSKKESEQFPRLYQTVSIGFAMQLLKRLIPKQGTEKPKDKAK